MLTVAVGLYAAIGLGTDSPPQMAARTHLLWAVLIVSAASTWVLTIKPDSVVSRLVIGATGGFNWIWILSFVGLPVVVASLLAVLLAAVGVPRRLGAAVVAVAAVGFALGLLVLRVTEPPGEHIFG